MSVVVQGMIIDITDAGGLLIAAPCPDLDRLVSRKSEKVLVEIQDGRTISADQRKKAHALIGEIAEWSGDTPEWLKKHMKIEFMTDRLQSLEKEIFSLSDCSMTTAREFISHLIDFILRFDVPTRVPLYELCDDTPRYVYACLINKRCAICGRRADLHHWDALGAGRDRTEIYQIGWPVISLCREHHQEANSKGMAWLACMYHLEPVPLDKEIGKKYKLSKRALGG